MVTLQTTLPCFSQPHPSPLSLLPHCNTITQIQQLHTHTIKTGQFNHDPITPIRIIQSCCTCFQFSPPESVIEVDYALSMVEHIVNSPSSLSFVYNILIRAYNQVDESKRAILLFCEMLNDPIARNLPDKFTFPFVVKSCSDMLGVEEGKQVHCFVMKSQFGNDPYVQSCLISMYGKCGKIESALKVFEGMTSENVVSWNAMVNGFIKAGDIVAAQGLFDKMPERNIVSWNSMIAGYARESLLEEAIDLLVEMQVLGVRPDESTLVGIISAISDLGLLSLGKRVHGYIMRYEFSLDSGLGATLIDMYSKCGRVYDAFQVFELILNKNVGHWTSIIVGLAIHGFTKAALCLFSEMKCLGVQPNHVTFVGVLSACSHGGLVEKGLEYFNLMRGKYNIEPKIQHYGCLVDLLARSGLLKEAKVLVESMPIEPDAVIWSTLLASCKNHDNVEIGEIAAERLMKFTPDYGSGYVLMSNLYAGSGRWKDFGRVRRALDERGVEKVAGLSWIEVDGKTHEFLAGDKYHPSSLEIYRLLGRIECQLR